MSKYHKGDKFIVEIKEVINSDNGTLYRSNFSTLVFNDYGLDSLHQAITPAEDGLVDKSKVEEAYNKGLNDGRNEVWELADKLNNMPMQDIIDIYGFNVDRCSVYSKITPQEALAKLEAYEKEQEKKIVAGDIVTTINGECEFLVTNVQLPNTIHTVNTRNGYIQTMRVGSVKKTGKHIDIQSVLQQIGE